MKEEFEEFQAWKLSKLTKLDQAFDKLDRMMSNPYLRIHDVGFKAIYECLCALREELKK